MLFPQISTALGLLLFQHRFGLHRRVVTTLACVQFAIDAASDLELSRSPNRWRVTGGRPTFDLGSSEPPKSGWYVVTTDLTSTQDSQLGLPNEPPISLRFLPASGSVPLARRPVPVVGGRRTRVVHVPPGTARVQLDVSPWVESVAVERVVLRPVPQVLAASIMASDVAASGLRGSTDGRAVLSRLRRAKEARGSRAAIEEVATAYEHLQHRRTGDGVDYPSWRIRNATVFDDDIERLIARCAELPAGGPSISVIMPVHDPDPQWLQSAIESVTGQSYTKWQLCLVDDASTNSAVRSLLDGYAAADSRILVRHRAENGHIAVASNDALAVATGEFVAFMDHDDELAPFALAALALAARGADIIYTDEDKIDGSGRHYDPHCKPGWNPELLLGQNYMSHLTAIRRTLVSDVGGLRPGFEGAQDHDLLLRATEATSPERIRHVPVVAYHWRAIEGSTALRPGEKNYTEAASSAALEERLGPGWKVSPAGPPTAYRCQPPLDDYPLVSILIPTRDRVDLLRQCVESLARTTYPAFEILILDNDSSDPETLNWLHEFDNGHDHRVVPAPGPFNYSAVNNLGAEQASGELLVLLNNDTEIIGGNWLSEMVRWALQPEVGAVGAKLLYPDDTIQHAGIVLGLGGLAGHGHLHEPADATGYFSRLALAHEVGAVTGACLLTWRTTWESLKGLDEELAVAFNDVDYCLRVRHEARQRIIWTPEAVLYHHESVSRGAEDDETKVARFNTEVDRVRNRWSSELSLDPAYSPNLTLEGDSFTLARQPRFDPPWAETLEAFGR